MTPKQEYVFPVMRKALDCGGVCVFPSEVSARGWLVAYAREYGAAPAALAMSADRFFQLFQPHDGRVKATPVMRRAFIAGFDAPLGYFLTPRTPKESRQRILQWIATILPQLHDVVESPVFPRLDPAMRRDVEVLYGGYASFLSRHGLYESSYEPPVPPTDPCRYFVLFPEATLGLELLCRRLGNPSWIERCPMPQASEPEVFCYGNHVEEIHAVLRTIADLLDHGVPARDILVSTAHDDFMIPRLVGEAEAYAVPLLPHRSLQPLAYPAGRLFRQLADVYASRFAYADMEALLLAPGVPWKDGEAALHRALLHRAVDLAIDQGSLDKDGDLWIAQLASPKTKHAKQDRERDAALLAWYRTFKSLVVALNTARGVDRFRSVFHQFEDQYLRPQGWTGFPGEELATFCVRHVETLARELALVGADDEPFLQAFVTYLEQLPYAPQLSTREGVDVYRWTDSGSLDAPYHFVLGLDADGAQCADTLLSCLPETLDDGERGVEDLSLGALRAASLGPARLSFHREDYGGRRTAAPSFTTIVPGPDGGPDPWREEERLWRGNEPGAAANGTQRTSFRQAEELGLFDGDRFERVLDPGVPVPDPIRLSYSALDRWESCPFRYGMQDVLHLREQEYEVGIVDPRTIGTMLHKAYELFFKEFEERTFLRSETDAYRKRLSACFDEAMEEVYGPSGPNPFIRHWIVWRYRDMVLGILEKEGENQDGTRTYAVEYAPAPVLRSVAGKDLELNGQIDRIIARGDGTYAVMDYKKHDAPMTSGSRSLKTFQLPFYRELFIGEGEVAAAYYYGVEKQKYAMVWSPEKPEWQQKGGEALDAAFQAFVEGVEDGRFPAKPKKDACNGCPFRTACRRRYGSV